MESNNMASSNTVPQIRFKKNFTHRSDSYGLPGKQMAAMLPSKVCQWRYQLIQNARISGTLVLFTLGLILLENRQTVLPSYNGVNIFRVMIMVMCVAEAIFVYQHHLIKLKEKKIRKEVYSRSSLCQDKRQLKLLVLDLMISLVCKPLFSKDDLEDLFLVLSLSKYYILFKNLVELSPRNTERTSFYCKQFNAEPGFSFILKCYVNDITILSVGFLWIFFLMNFALIVRTVEKEYSEFYKYLWLSGITQTTVGYGDVVPTSSLGRFFSGLNAICGTFMLSLTLMFIRNYLELDKDQYRFYKKVKVVNVNLNKEACLLLQSWWRYLLKRKEKKPRLLQLYLLRINYCRFKKSRLGPHFQKLNSLKRELKEVRILLSKQFEVSYNSLKIIRDIEIKAKTSMILAINFRRKLQDLKFRHHFNDLKETRKEISTNRNQSRTVRMKLKRDLAHKKHRLKIPDSSKIQRHLSQHPRLIPSSPYPIGI